MTRPSRGGVTCLHILALVSIVGNSPSKTSRENDSFAATWLTPALAGARPAPNEMVVYEGAPHSFFDRAFDRYREACDDAWRRMPRFVGASAA
jgi:carboxymethylenebutenolidase